MPWNIDFGRKLWIGIVPFAAVLLTVSGTMHYHWSRSTLERESRQQLNQDWAAMKGYLRLENVPHTQTMEALWFYDETDADETAVVSRLRDASLIMDEHGRMLHESRIFQEINTDIGPEMSRMREGLTSRDRGNAFWIVRQSTQKQQYLIRVGIVMDEGRRSPNYIAIATPLTQNIEALRVFDYTSLGVVFGALLLGWSLGRLIWRWPSPT